MIRRAAAAWQFWIALAAISVATHLIWAHASHNGANLARCGALWVVFAAALVARPIIRMGYRNWFDYINTIDGGHMPPTPEEIEADRQAMLDAISMQYLGPTLAVLGTLLWAYGDILGNAMFAVSQG